MNILKKFAHISVISAIAVSCAYGQATRTYVSGVGDDANPCSRTAPCKTFAGAISKTAAGGEMDALDPGGFGSVTITKSITIDGGAGTVSSILASGTNGIVIIAATTDVVILRNLTFQGLGSGLTGVSVLQAKAVHFDNVGVFNFAASGISVSTSAASFISLNHVVLENNATSGVTFTTSSGLVQATVTNSKFSANGVGLVAADNSKVSVQNSSASGNTGAGFSASSTSANSTLDLITCIASNNGGAGVQATGTGSAAATVRIGGSASFSNASAFSTGTGGSIYSYGDNDTTGIGAPTSSLTKQ